MAEIAWLKVDEWDMMYHNTTQTSHNTFFRLTKKIISV